MPGIGPRRGQEGQQSMRVSDCHDILCCGLPLSSGYSPGEGERESTGCDQLSEYGGEESMRLCESQKDCRRQQANAFSVVGGELGCAGGRVHSSDVGNICSVDILEGEPLFRLVLIMGFDSMSKACREMFLF